MNRLVNLELLPRIFRSSEIIKLSKGKITRRSLGYAISKLVMERKLVMLKKGIYSKTGDIFYMAQYLYKGYIGLSSALYLYGLKEEVENAVYVCVKSPAKKVTRLGVRIVPVNMSRMQYGTHFVEHEGNTVLVSTYAKTVFDMLSRPKYANYFDMYRAIGLKPLTSAEWRELLGYAESSDITDIRRTGYATDGIAPKWFTEDLIKLSKKGYRTSFFFGHIAKSYNCKWSIYDSIGIRRWVNAV